LEVPPDKLVELLHEVIWKLTGRTSDGSAAPQTPQERVFIVHGHNLGIKEAVARFIERLGPAVIILHEQPNEGRTIIEKFESHSDADYAVVLLTADDTGGPKNGTKTASVSFRARQNVIFELGFFAAKLGRSRVSVLYEEGVEIPSDFSGILYIPVDLGGSWRFKLARELKTAGLTIDLNNAL
jgi:predicted nucleotide-binding protein